METCINCERKIGNLEVAHMFNGHVVCAECNQVLINQENSESKKKKFEPQVSGTVSPEIDNLNANVRASIPPQSKGDNCELCGIKFYGDYYQYNVKGKRVCHECMKAMQTQQQNRSEEHNTNQQSVVDQSTPIAFGVARGILWVILGIIILGLIPVLLELLKAF